MLFLRGKYMQFKLKLVGATSMILLLSLSMLSINQYLQVKDSVDMMIEESVDEIGHDLSANIAGIMQGKKILGSYIMDLIEDDITTDNIDRVYTKSAVKEAFILAGVGFESDGSIVDNDPNWNPAADYDSRTRPWYIEAKKESSIIYTAPYPDSVTKEIVVSMGIPMNKDGRFHGAMFLDISLSGLGEILNRVAIMSTGYAFLISSDGQIISHPDVAYNGKQAHAFFGSSLDFRSTEFKDVDVNGKTWMTKFSKVQGVDWYLGVALDKEQAHAVTTSLRNQAFLYSAAALVFGIIAMLVLIKRLMRPLDDISTAMQDIASGDGDLTQRLSTTGDVEFVILAQGFNSFSINLQSLIGDCKSLATDISQNTHQTTQGAEIAVSAMHQQLSELEQLATAMNEMSSTALEVSGYAKQAAESASQADVATQEGASIVSDTSESILLLSRHIEAAVGEVKQLEDSTASIETILSVINGIAEQTNLLALNAAIEAARAGEQGRGFAVVADEVRNLAQRTQESTSQIKNMIEVLQQGSMSVANVMSQSQSEATKCVEKAQLANEALSSISGAINQITEMNLQIASAAQEQSLVAEEVNRNTTNIKDLSQKVVDNAQVTNAAMSEQLEVTEKQHNLLNRFII
jgi:methyl-accepting chemotaxis protein